MMENKNKRKGRNQKNSSEKSQAQGVTKISEQQFIEIIDKKDVTLLPEKRQTILKTIEVRLDGVGEAARRTKLTFIISIIASLAILITLWNTYFSWTSRFAFDRDFKFTSTKINDLKTFTNKMDSGNFPLYKWLFDKLDLGTQNTLQQLKAKEKIVEQEKKDGKDSNAVEQDYTGINEGYKDVQIGILGKINSLLENKLLYQDIKKPYCASLDNIINELQKSKIQEDYKSSEIKIHEKEKQKRCDFKNGKSEDGKDKKSEEDRELEKIFISDDDGFNNRTNLINKFLLERGFETQITWEIVSVSSNASLPTYENNRRIRATEWIKNQNVPISFLGVSINASEFSFLGSFCIAIISFWLFFSFRRENRAIVSLLRDVRKDVNRPSKKQKIGDDNWDIANLAFQGIAHKFIFAHTGKTDLPMSSYDIFGNSNKKKKSKLLNGFNELINFTVSKITKIVRILSLMLLFLPVVTIFITIYVDINTTNNLSPFSSNPFASLILTRTGMNNVDQITIENYFAFIFGIITLLVCSACLIFQFRTTRALKDFEAKLNPKAGKNLEKTKRAIIEFFEQGYSMQVRNSAK